MAKYTVCLLIVFAEFVVGSVMGVIGERAGLGEWFKVLKIKYKNSESP